MYMEGIRHFLARYRVSNTLLDPLALVQVAEEGKAKPGSKERLQGRLQVCAPAEALIYTI